MNARVIRILLFFALPAVMSRGAPAGAESLTPDELVRVAQGEIIVRTLATEGATAGRVLAAVEIPAAAGVVWAVMVDVERAPEFIPGLRRARVLERGASHELIEHTVKYAALLPEFTYRYRADYRRPERIDFQRVSGDLRVLQGAWQLRPDGDVRTVVVYSVFLDPGFFVPQWLVRQSLRQNLPAVLRALRTRVHALAPAPLSRARPVSAGPRRG